MSFGSWLLTFCSAFFAGFFLARFLVGGTKRRPPSWRVCRPLPEHTKENALKIINRLRGLADAIEDGVFLGADEKYQTFLMTGAIAHDLKNHAKEIEDIR